MAREDIYRRCAPSFVGVEAWEVNGRVASTLNVDVNPAMTEAQPWKLSRCSHVHSRHGDSCRL